MDTLESYHTRIVFFNDNVTFTTTDALNQETSLRIDKRRPRTRRKRRMIIGIYLKATFPIDLPY